MQGVNFQSSTPWHSATMVLFVQIVLNLCYEFLQIINFCSEKQPKADQNVISGKIKLFLFPKQNMDTKPHKAKKLTIVKNFTFF